jgi:inositol phosphorylceramide mannosyltransferase catalytic subunit
MAIPRTIHQIWIGPDPLPEDHRGWIETWRTHHPEWEHRLWTEDDLPDDPIRPEVLDRMRMPVERADILRLEILYRQGGVYVDTDVECLRPVDDVLAGHDFVGVCLKPGRPTNTMIASVAGHPLLKRALEEVRPMDVYWTLNAETSIKDGAGPPLLRRLVGDFPEVKLLPPALCFPATPAEREEALAVHHMARSWHNFPAMRTAMLEAERRMEEAKAELEKEKRRHAATQKRLAKLEKRRRR